MMTHDQVLDLIDTIANHELHPIAYSGRGMYGAQCVGCVIDRRSSMQDLPKSGCVVDSMGLDYIVYWPRAEWTPEVQFYVETITDSSGKCGDDR